MKLTVWIIRKVRQLTNEFSFSFYYKFKAESNINNEEDENGFLDQVKDFQKSHCDDILKIQECLNIYQNDLELIEEIFKRIENYMSSNVDENEKQKQYNEFKEQLKFELDNFKKNDEAKLIVLIKEFYAKKLQIVDNIINQQA